MKRMFDKKEIVDIIQEESPKIEVDSELSETSENPVQNKVIYEALGDKQDALPDTTGQTDKFLKVGADGLEWGEAGGGEKKYLHVYSFIFISGTKTYIYIVTNKDSALTKEEIRVALVNAGYNSSSHCYPIIGLTGMNVDTNNKIIYYRSFGLYGTGLGVTNSGIKETITIDPSTGNASSASSSYNESVSSFTYEGKQEL